MLILLTFCSDKQVEQLDTPDVTKCRGIHQQEEDGKHKALLSKKKSNCLFSCLTKILQDTSLQSLLK